MIDRPLLERIASQVGTPFWHYDAATLRKRIADIQSVAQEAGIQSRYAMKACSATRVVREMLSHGVWIDAVSGNEVLRAIRAGAPGGHRPPVVMLTADVFRDNALRVVHDEGVLINVGSPGMTRELEASGYKGPIGVRVNPGFGHGHVNACDTGGPSSKHGIWWTQAAEFAADAERRGLRVVLLHAHIGSGPKFEELMENLDRLATEFAGMAKMFPNLEAVSLGGGIPHVYREDQPQPSIAPLGPLFREARKRLCEAAGRELRVEIEPGRYFVAPMATLVARVADVKSTETNEKGQGHRFVMVDAGFVDLIRPAMYGSYHRMTLAVDDAASRTTASVVVAGPLCESGDVFTRDASELLAPRVLPEPRAGDLLLLHDGGAYGYAMSSNYNSIGRAPQVWVEPDGAATVISRRETLDDVLKAETDGPLTRS